MARDVETNAISWPGKKKLGYNRMHALDSVISPDTRSIVLHSDNLADNRHAFSLKSIQVYTTDNHFIGLYFLCRHRQQEIIL